MTRLQPVFIAMLAAVAAITTITTSDVVTYKKGAGVSVIDGEVVEDDPTKSYIKVSTLDMHSKWVERTIARRQLIKIERIDGNQGKPEGESAASPNEPPPLPTLEELYSQWPNDFFKAKVIGKPEWLGQDPDDPRIWVVQQRVRVTKDRGAWNRFAMKIRKRLEHDLGRDKVKSVRWTYSKIRLTPDRAPDMPEWLTLSVDNANNPAHWGKYSRLNQQVFFGGLAKAADSSRGDMFVFLHENLQSGWAVHPLPDLFDELSSALRTYPTIRVTLTNKGGTKIAPAQERKFGHVRSHLLFDLCPNGSAGGMDKAPRLATVSPHNSYVDVFDQIYMGESMDLIFLFEVPVAVKELIDTRTVRCEAVVAK